MSLVRGEINSAQGCDLMCGQRKRKQTMTSGNEEDLMRDEETTSKLIMTDKESQNTAATKKRSGVSRILRRLTFSQGGPRGTIYNFVEEACRSPQIRIWTSRSVALGSAAFRSQEILGANGNVAIKLESPGRLFYAKCQRRKLELILSCNTQLARLRSSMAVGGTTWTTECAERSM
uniref:Pentatricopeptide repeat-containing protein n=1 Tax=Steinernema glaseri TaxID=37863 RepID=A0A1I8APP0_9BILA